MLVGRSVRWCAVVLGGMVLGGPALGAEWRLLRHTEVEASSFLQSNWNKYSENYHPNYVADDDPKTAWVEGVDGNGEGQTLRLPTSVIKSARAVKLQVRNGYQKSEGLLVANAAPKQVRIGIDSGHGITVQETVTLERKMGWQEVVVDLPGGEGVAAVELTIDSVHPGSKYKDTCISDIQVYVDTDVPYRAAIEEARYQRLKAWTAERRKTAAYFASLPATYPFAATAYRRTDGPTDDQAAVEKDLQALKKEAGAAGKAAGWWKMTRKRGGLESPDQLWAIRDFIDLYQPAELAWFETDDKFAKKKKETFDYGYVETHQTNAKVTFSDTANAVPATIWFELHDAGEERGPWRNTREVYARCDDQGRPTVVFIRSRSYDELGDLENLTRFTMEWSDSGQVVRIEQVSRTYILGEGGAFEAENDGQLFSRQVFTPATGV